MKKMYLPMLAVVSCFVAQPEAGVLNGLSPEGKAHDPQTPTPSQYPETDILNRLLADSKTYNPQSREGKFLQESTMWLRVQVKGGKVEQPNVEHYRIRDISRDPNLLKILREKAEVALVIPKTSSINKFAEGLKIRPGEWFYSILATHFPGADIQKFEPFIGKSVGFKVDLQHFNGVCEQKTILQFIEHFNSLYNDESDDSEMLAFCRGIALITVYDNEGTAHNVYTKKVDQFKQDLVNAIFNNGQLDPNGYAGVQVIYSGVVPASETERSIVYTGQYVPADQDFVALYNAGKINTWSIGFEHNGQHTSMNHYLVMNEALLALVGDHDRVSDRSWNKRLHISRLISPEAAAQFLSTYEKTVSGLAVSGRAGNRIMSLKQFLTEYPQYQGVQGLWISGDPVPKPTKSRHAPRRHSAPAPSTHVRSTHVTSREVSELLVGLMRGTYAVDDKRFQRFMNVDREVVVGKSNRKSVSAVIRYYQEKGGIFAGVVHKITNQSADGTQYIIYADGTKIIYPDGTVKFKKHRPTTPRR